MAENLHSENMNENFNKKLQFLVLLDKMKTVYRQTLLADKSRRETDAEHSWHMAVMAFVFSDLAPEGVNTDRVIKMCLVHDLIEIFAGDTFCYDEKAGEDKEEREKLSADRLFAILPEEDGKEIRALWEEFEAQSTPDALFAASLDRFQPIINNFLTDGHTWKKGNVKRKQVEKRASVIEKGFPAAWKTVCDIISDSDEKGLFNKN